MKEKTRNTEVQINEEEIGKLPEKEFRIMVLKTTFRRTPISRSPLDKNPMPGHLFELHPVNEVNTKGQ